MIKHLWLLCSIGLYAAPPVPLPEMSVPKTAHAPVLDGVMSPGEWDRAAACTGFVKAFDGGLTKYQSTAWITFDDRYLYVAFHNYRGPGLTLLSANGRRLDDDRIVYDPSNEVWFSPPGLPAATYQSLINAYPAVFDAKMIPSLGYTSKAWSGAWEIAARQNNEGWTVEARTPIHAYGVDHIADGATWRALFATDILADGDKFRAWAPGGAFADIPRHGFLHFTNDGPALQFIDMETIASGHANLVMEASAGAKGGTVKVTARFGAAVEAAASDAVINKSVDLSANASQKFNITADLTAARAKMFEITAKAGNTTIYHQVFPVAVDGSVRKPPANVISTPYKQAFGLEGSYAPLSKKLLVKIDRYYMPQRTNIAGGKVTLTEIATGKVVAERPISGFRQDYSEFPVELAKLAVPVETEQNWKSKVSPAAYKLTASLNGKNGAPVAEASTTVQLLSQQFPWLPNDIGISPKVIPPWTPMQAQGNTIGMWNKAYTLDGAGLAQKIVNTGAPQMAGPMHLEAVVDGHAVTLAAPNPETSGTTEAGVDLKGEAQGGALKINTKTRVEFDGFVWNTMTVQPTKSNVERLSLMVNLPESEAPYFVTTSGGWSAYHGATPARWDSRETSLTTMAGNFVPYVFLTDSERGFCWFADNNKGWRLNPALPTQELLHHDGLVTLRVNFINAPGAISQPLTIQYGWMVTPQKPQPKGWRGYLISSGKYSPHATALFWNEADWDVLWPYYSSPFPKDYQKSKALLAGSVSNDVKGCVGDIAHSIGRYIDSEHRPFYAFAADWGSTPGDNDNGNVARGRGPNDFQLFHFDKWSKTSGLGCLYFDENYLAEDWNYLTGGAYLLPDERVQPGYSYLGLREYNKRLRNMFFANNKPSPNLWEHTTGGHAVYAWMPDVSMEAENVEPTDLTNDYIEALPASRLRSIGMGRNLGTAPFIMCQAARHWQGENSQALVNQFAGWVLAHDTLPESVDFWPVLSAELDLWKDDVQFLPYWKKGLGIDPVTAGIEVSAHARPGNAVLWVINSNREDKKADVKLDLAKLGFDPARPVVAYDAETSQRYIVQNGVLQVTVPKRMWRAVRLIQPKLLNNKLTFTANFDTEVSANEAFGSSYPVGKTLEPAAPDGRRGKCAAFDNGLAFLARHHVTQESGSVSFLLHMTDTQFTSGNVVTIGTISVGLVNGRLAMNAGKGEVRPSEPIFPDKQWNELTIAWKGMDVQLTYNGAVVVSTTLTAPLQLPGMGRGLDIREQRRHIEPATINFGPLRGARLDDLKMSL